MMYGANKLPPLPKDIDLTKTAPYLNGDWVENSENEYSAELCDILKQCLSCNFEEYRVKSAQQLLEMIIQLPVKKELSEAKRQIAC